MRNHDFARLARGLFRGELQCGCTAPASTGPCYKDLVQELREKVDIVLTWPINHVRALDEVHALGITGVISDEMDVLAETLRRRRST